ncbi:MAG: hypothetical protein JO033_04895 [Acidobacteriaceae bacterium]|nr:hypothetical protein [Acidobacteriaceae bacterium]MBV9500078.1 hypothetical protein [Acidobacteriaceae bacterium]
MLLDEAADLAQDSDGSVTAVLVWDGQARGEDDLTFSFGEEARNRGFPVIEIDTLRAGAAGAGTFEK